MDEAWDFWIDRGGTFTDIVARAPDGTLNVQKLLSDNPVRYEDAALEGIRQFLGLQSSESIPLQRINSVKMGTTVATNALLERKGEPTVLVITRGLCDQLRIAGQKRPDLFARHILLPEQLYGRIIEADERVMMDGTVLAPLDEVALRRDLMTARADGFTACAIVFIHGYRYQSHEAQAGAIARESGFEQVSISHEVSPLMKMNGRGDTTIVDAYLSPILRRYVDRVAAAFDGDPVGCLQFMMSSGGLTDAALFQGKDAILSGPAGGVVGGAKTAQIAGFKEVVGFDMGGTSTDVWRYDGAYERAFDTEVAGVRIQAPMMHIHTVAAGGGSILCFDGQRMRVGPQSAGADPGPASYGCGGPLAVTDANVMTGKLRPEFFPEIFGPEGNASLDAEIVREKFTALAADIGKSPEEVADGFLKIAVENMAAAIKKISVQRGYDVSEYCLGVFGGAGAQHACLVADALGMETALVHPLASVLSAYGMGLAEIRAARQKAMEKQLDEASLSIAEEELAELAHIACDEVSGQGVAPDAIKVSQTLHIKLKGTDTTLPVVLQPFEALRAAFAAVHKARFGFRPGDEKALIIEALSVEAVGQPASADEPELTTGQRAETEFPTALEGTFFSGGKTRQARFVRRSDLQPGDTLTGSAVLIEDHTSIVVEEGWQARITAHNHVLLRRIMAREDAHAIGTEADPVMLEVFNNLYMSIAEQMGAVLENTAVSVTIKERLDFSCAVFDAEGDLIANAPHMPVHLGSMSASVKTIRNLNPDMAPGDVYVLNAPYNGGTHLPDITVVKPIWDESGKDVLFYTSARGHQTDVGGLTPGSAPPDSRVVEDEGVLIDNFKLVEGDAFREEALRDILTNAKYPARNPEENILDLKAQVAACQKGAKELLKMVDHFGLDVVRAYMRHVQDNAEESVRRRITALKDATCIYPMDPDFDGQERAIHVRISVNTQSRSATVDFTGTTAQLATNYNAPEPVTRAAVLYVFRCLVDDAIPMNEGVMKPLNVVLPKGTMLSPQYPAAVIAGNTETSQAVTNALFQALGVMAGAQGTMNNTTWGNDRYQYYETVCGGAGAGWLNSGVGHPGTSAVHTHMTNSRLTDPEVLEFRFPVLLEEFTIRKGSGGAGRFAGGDGVTRKIRILEPMTMAQLAGHRVVPPPGLDGGAPGQVGRTRVIRWDGSVEELGSADMRQMDFGDLWVLETPGGGGCGRAIGELS